MNLNTINEKICGYSLCFTFFFILISTAVANISIFISMITGIIVIINKKEFFNVFIKNKLNLSIVILTLLFLFSFFYSIASAEEAFSNLKKYIKLLYIPICFYILQYSWVRDKSIQFFILGGSIILFLSYLKYYNIFNPAEIPYFFNIEYNDKLLGTVTTVFQHAIIHGVVLSFYSYITFVKAKNDSSIVLYSLSFLSFYNVLFLNISRTGYIIISLLLLLILINYAKKNSYKNIIIILMLILSAVVIGNKTIISDRVNDVVKDTYDISNSNFNTSLGYRYIWFLNGYENIKKSPFIGFGIGSYKETTKKYTLDNNVQGIGFVTQNPHNEYISISSQLGILGLISFIYFLLNLFRNRNTNDVSTAVLIVILVGCTMNSLFYDNILGIFSVLIIGLSMQKNLFIRSSIN